ncbi:MAG: cytochrome c3 family protein [Burkholderiaceae bacterium]
MIRCKLVETIHPDETQVGARVGRAVSGEMLSLGRAAACKIFLPDPRVRLEHATIRRAEDGALYLEATGPVAINQRAQTSVRLAVGQKITIGPYDFIVEEVEDGHDKPDPRLTLSFALRVPVPGTADANKPGLQVGLVPGWLSRRSLAWVLSLLVLVLCGAWPVWHAFQPVARVAVPGNATAAVAAQLRANHALQLSADGEAPVPTTDVARMQARLKFWVAAHGQRLDTFWNPGTIASAHQGFAQDCRSCHDTPFARVTDASCTTCHRNVGDHVSDATIAHNTLTGQRCATCHKEHQGQAGMRTTDTVGCAQCHGNIRAFTPLTTLENVSDFATQHPEFRLSIRQHDAARSVQRVRQTAQLRNDTGLVFPHDIHLAAKGIKSPTGPAATSGRVVLECASCHTLDAAGVRFEPVTMAQNCQSCHRLSVDPQAPEREVPHARPEVVEVAVREIYASLAVDRFPVSLTTVNALLQRPTGRAPASQSTSAGRWVEQRSSSTFQQMFAKRNGVCTTCHAVVAEKASGKAPMQWSVPAIVETTHWLPQSTFSHAQHKNAECVSCHNAKTSKLASEILIPDIQSCRTCHTGAKPDQEKVVSQCDSCHEFHPRKEHPAFQQATLKTGAKP